MFSGQSVMFLWVKKIIQSRFAFISIFLGPFNALSIPENNATVIFGDYVALSLAVYRVTQDMFFVVYVRLYDIALCFTNILTLLLQTKANLWVSSWQF